MDVSKYKINISGRVNISVKAWVFNYKINTPVKGQHFSNKWNVKLLYIINIPGRVNVSVTTQSVNSIPGRVKILATVISVKLLKKRHFIII